MSFPFNFSWPNVLSTDGVLDAMDDTNRRLIFGSMSPWGYAERIFNSPEDLRDLPVGYMRRQYVRGPRLASVSQADLARMLARMLSSSGNVEAIDMIASTLDLSPARDAAELFSFKNSAPKFFEACCRGNLEAARDIISAAPWADPVRESAEKLVIEMLCYHLALKLQLIAARAWQFDHLKDVIERQMVTGTKRPIGFNMRPLKEQGVMTWFIHDLCEPIDIIDTYHKKCIDEPDNKIKEPNNNSTKPNKPRAEAIQAASGITEKEMLTALSSFWPRLAAENKRVHKELEKIREGVKGRNRGRTMQTAVFGLPGVQALCYASVRLVQLIAWARAQNLSDIQRARFPNFPTRISAADRDRIDRIMFVHRLFLLGETTWAVLVGINGRVKMLADQFDAARGSGNYLCEDILRDLRKTLLREEGLDRHPWRGRGPLTGGQRFDLLPEFFFSSLRVAPPASASGDRAKRRNEKISDYLYHGKYKAARKTFKL